MTVFDISQKPSMQGYLDLLVQFNAAMNLVGPMDRGSMERELILDSLAPVGVWPGGAVAMDVGSGAGLPGIPLAIAFPETRFLLVEPRKKRAQFLKICAHRLGLENVEVFEARLEDREWPDLDLAISKAVFSPPEFLEKLTPRVRSGGHLISMYAASASAELSDAAERLGLMLVAEVADVSQVTGHATDVGRAVRVWKKP